jgi:glycosyltransferase involved in cell wall biosynthesis
MMTYQVGPVQRAATLGIVVPCYNESEALEKTTEKLIAILQTLCRSGRVSNTSKIYFVDDGSTDDTWSLIERIGAQHSCITGVKLSRNMGHQGALLAGLMTADGDVLVSLDADLQDDVSVIGKMMDAYYSGDDIVYAVRSGRRTDTFFKRFTAERFYALMRALGVDIIVNHADFRLMSRRAIAALAEFREVNLFLRALVRLTGFKHSTVYYERGTRVAGKSKYPLAKMIAFALNGITSFSATPLRLITFIGLSIFMLSVLMSGWVVYTKFYVSTAVPGWASTVLPIYFIGGIQIMCIGVIGEYLGKVYLETKQRPRFIVDRVSGAAVSVPYAPGEDTETVGVSTGSPGGYRATRADGRTDKLNQTDMRSRSWK